MKSRQLKLFINGVVVLTSLLAYSISVRATTKDPRFFVTNPQEFNHYVVLHKKRTRLLALRLFEKYQEEYSALTKSQVDEFISLHDQSKSIPAVAQRLYKQYSRPIDEINPRRKAQFNAWVNYLNERDHGIAQDFFLKNYLSATQIGQLLEIEKIADLVDRSFDPVAQEDFARKMLPASEYISDHQMAAKAQFLEGEYENVTRGLAFLDANQSKVKFCKFVL